MDLPNRGRGNLMSYFNRFARGEAGRHANQHFPSTSKAWRVKRGKKDAGASFDLSGPCQGALEEVQAIGLRLAQDAIEAGNVALADRIIARIESVKIEYEIAEQERSLARLEAEAAKVIKAQAIVAKRK